MAQNILIIRLGALGDILLSMQAFQDIRHHYPKAKITFLTTPAFAGLARQMPWFNHVIETVRPSFYQIGKWLAEIKTLKQTHYDLVIDLQNKPRTSFYYHLIFRWRKTEWSGAAFACKYPRPILALYTHHQDKIIAQIRKMGVTDSGSLNTDWLQADIRHFNLPEKYAVLIAGCAPHRPEKRWPVGHFIELAKHLINQDITPVCIGTKADEEAVATLCKACEKSISLLGKTSFAELAEIFRHSQFVIGNDTGPTHLAGLVGAATLALFSGSSNPQQSSPKGPHVQTLQRDPLKNLSVEEVLLILKQQ